MSTRDEAVATVVQALGGEAIIDPIPAGIALDALIAEGWRKMPSESELTDVIAQFWAATDTPEDAARAVLALMNRGQ